MPVGQEHPLHRQETNELVFPPPANLAQILIECIVAAAVLMWAYIVQKVCELKNINAVSNLNEKT